MAKILFFLSETPFPPFNGFRLFSFNILIRLAKNNEIKCIEIHNNEYENNKVCSFSKRKYQEFPNIKEITSIGIKRKFIPNALKYFLNTILIKPSYLNIISKKKKFLIQKHINNYKPDIIIIDSQSFGLNFAIMQFKHNAKTIILQRDTHSLSLIEEIRNKLYSNLIEKYFKKIQIIFSQRIERKNLNFFNFIQVHSEFEKNYLIKLIKNINKKSILVLPTGVYTNENSNKLNNKSTLLKFLTISPLGKGNKAYLDFFIKNDWIPFLSKFKNARLTVVSSYNISKKYIKQVSKFNIEIIGFQKSLKSIYEKNDVVLSLVRKRAGIINKIIDGFANKKLVIGYKDGFTALKHAFNKKHYLSDENEISLSKIMMDIQSNKYDLDNIINNAFNYSKKYHDWNKVVAEFEKNIL